MQGDKGGAIGKKKRRPPPVPRAHKQATIWAAENLLHPEVVNRPRTTPRSYRGLFPGETAPRSKVRINVPSNAPPAGRQAVRLENNRYKAARAAVVPGTKVKINGKHQDAQLYLARTMPQSRRKEYNDALARTPATPREPGLGGFLHRAEEFALPRWAGLGRAAAGVAKSTYEDIEPFVPILPTGGRSAPGRVPSARRQQEATKHLVGNALYNAITKGETSHLGAAGLEALTVLPVARPLRFGRALGVGLVASRDARTALEAKQVFKAAYEGEMGGPMLPAKIYAAASRNRAIQGLAPREQLHAVIDQVVPSKVLARQMKKEADGHAHLESLATTGTLAERRQAASRVYDDYLTSVQTMPEHPISGFEPVVAEAKGKTNLAQAQKAAKIEAQAPKSTPARSAHVPAADDEGVVATGHQVVGEITPEEWWTRVQHSVGNNAELGLSLAHWYRELGPIFRTIFGEDGNAVLRGFAVSQANASPAGGLLNVLKVRDKILLHQRISKDEISTVVRSIEAAFKGQPVEKGLQAKLHDFANSLEGKKTRTWTLDDVRGGAPAAIDVHAARDLGWIDRRILTTLRDRHGLPVAHLQLQKLDEELRTLVGRKQPKKSTLDPEAWRTAQDEEIAKKKRQITAFKKKNKTAIAEGKKSGLVMDNASGSPSGYRYEAGRVRYEAIANHLNEIKAWGKDDWTPAEAQALGWSSIQRIHGVNPEDAQFAIKRNTYTVALETLNEHTTLGLRGFDAQMAATKEVVESILPKLIAEENGYLRGITYGSGGWKKTVTPAAQITVVATPDQVDRMVFRLAGMFDQQDVWGVRAGVSISKRKGAGAGKAALEVFSSDFGDPARVGVFWHHLQDALPANLRRHVSGYSTFKRGDQTGIRIITEAGPVAEAKGPAWARQFSGALADARDNAKLRDLDYHHTNVEVRSIATAKGSARTRSVLRRAGRLPGMGDPLEAEARQTLGQALARHREAEGSVGRGAATEARRTGFEGPPTPEEEAWRRMHQYREPLSGEEELPLGSRHEPPVRGVPVQGAEHLHPQTLEQAQASFHKVAVKTSALRARSVELLGKLDKTPAEWEELDRIKLQLRSKQPVVVPRAAPRPIEDVAGELYESLPGARSQLGKQSVVQRTERAKRLGAAREARAEAGGGLAGHRAARAQLRGELPTLKFRSGLRPDEVDRLIHYVEDNNLLGDDIYKTGRLADAFTRIANGRIPQKSQIKLLEEVFGTEQVQAVQDDITRWHRALDIARDIASLPRALRSSIDFSAPFRQGLFMLTAEPSLWAKSWPKGANAMWTKENHERLMAEILSRPTAKAYRRGKLAIVDEMDGPEEAYMSNLASKIPFVNHSQRGYTGFLNRLRADAFDHLYYQGIAEHPEWATDDVFLQSIGEMVNMLTGRGRIPGHEMAVKSFSAALFSPRLIASRVEYLLQVGNPLMWAPGLGDPRKALARRTMRRSLAGMVGSAGLVLTLASFLPGVDVGTDPRSADFLKIRVGDFRMDILGGAQQYLVLGSRLVSGEKTNSSTGEVKKLGSFGHPRVMGTLMDFLDNKAAPVPAFLLAWDAGMTPIGEKFDFWTQLRSTVTPLGVESGVQTSQDYGWPVGALDYALSSVGFGTGVYGAKPRKRPLRDLPVPTGGGDIFSGGGDNVFGGGGGDVFGG